MKRIIPIAIACLTFGSQALAQPTGDKPTPATGDEARPRTADPARAGSADAARGAATTDERPAPRQARAADPAPPPRRVEPTSKAKEDEKATPAPKKANTGFGFGSYGRIGISTDAKGGTGRQANLVAHGPRLGEGPYVELDLYYKLRPFRDIELKTVITLAFTEELFHFSGDWSSALALRNFYLEGSDLFVRGLSLWMGSRMYRGDDIYLLDFWPLDNLNTIGGGIEYAFGRTRIGWHAGVNRLKDQYQYQEVLVPGLNNTSETVVLLNRQRLITSLKAEQQLGGRNGKLGAKIKLYGEFHHLPKGTLNAHRPEEEQEQLQSDFGWLVGAQLGLWNFGPRSHANLFVRYAQGLAAYGEFAIPFGLATDKRAKNARELVLALSANYETKRWFGLQAGAYVRYFKDADPNEYDWDDGWEYVAVLRPHLFLHRLFAIAVELSYQAKNPAGLNPWSHHKETPGVVKLSIMPLLTFGKGTYGRPQFRLIYTVYGQNKGARLSYNPADPQRNINTGHYLGIQAEWWFNSTYR
ncbi:MAG: carbohydrate porin [bacterium]